MTTGLGIHDVTRRLLRWSARLVLLALALTVAAALCVVVLLPRATHGAALTVLTGSMTPTIPVGSVVVLRPVDPHTLQPGDIATYQAEEGDPTYITHRVTKVLATSGGLAFTFKGDANPAPDMDPVPAGAVRGKVWFHVPYLGAVRDALHGKGGISLVAMLVLAGYALSQLSGAFSDRRRRVDTVAPEKSEPRPSGIDRTVVLVELALPASPTAADIADLARTWSGVVVGVSGAGCSLLVAPPPGELTDWLDRIRAAGPLRLQIWDPSSGLTEPITSAPSVSTLREVQHAGT